VKSFEKLKGVPSAANRDIDLLVAIDDDNWISPWPHGEDEPKHLSESLLSWKSNGRGRASYLERPQYDTSKDWWKQSKVAREKLCAYQIWPDV
jgi:hypothetical protein